MSAIEVSDRDDTDLEGDLAALRANLKRTIGSTPDITRLIRRGIRQMIVEIETELARRAVPS